MHINEIKLHLSNYQDFFNWYDNGQYSDQPIETLSKSELREALSYFLDNTDNQLVNKIAYAAQHNTFFSWKSKELNLVTEAQLLKKLQVLGYDIKLVSEFPNDTAELLKLCTKLDTKSNLKNKFYNVKFKLSTWLAKQPWYLIFVCVGLIAYFNLTLLMWSLFISYVIWAVTELPKHDYIEHRYIIPKNKFIKYLVDFLLYMLNPSMYSDRVVWQKLHDQHHKNWRTEQDRMTYAIDRGIIYALSSFKPFEVPDSLEQYQTEYKVFPWLFTHLVKIKLVLALVLLLWLGPQLFLYLVAIPAGLKLGFEGQHDWFILRFGERNYWFLWPIALNQAWHLQHHQTYNRAPNSWSDIFLGPSWIRYVNPQYYIARSLFKINKSLR